MSGPSSGPCRVADKAPAPRPRSIYFSAVVEQARPTDDTAYRTRPGPRHGPLDMHCADRVGGDPTAAASPIRDTIDILIPHVTAAITACAA
eukprot:scaffold7798_cov126-Isochrysis_galbana.AAC.1